VTEMRIPLANLILICIAGGASYPVRFIANKTVHEYVSQGSVTETIGGAGLAAYKRANAETAAAHAMLEVAFRGLVVTVVDNYYGVIAADAKLIIVQRALDDANHFSSITGKRESRGEVAPCRHGLRRSSDTAAPARLERCRACRRAGPARSRSLSFQRSYTPYRLTSSVDELPNLSSLPEIETSAMNHNPDLKAAMESLHDAPLGVTAAKFADIPDLSINYSYGIDSAQFAVRAPDGSRNLGYSVAVTIDLPVWDWFATHSRLHENTVRRDQARVELTVTQRQLIASLHEAYQEAQVSLEQLRLLDQGVRSAIESLRLTNLRYSSGDGSVLEVVDSQNTLVQADSSRADGAARYFSALANLQSDRKHAVMITPLHRSFRPVCATAGFACIPLQYGGQSRTFRSHGTGREG
jgi:outer membrane protein TolC